MVEPAGDPPLSFLFRRFAALFLALFLWRPYLHLVHTTQFIAQTTLDHTAKMGQGGVGIDEKGSPADDRFRGPFAGGRPADFPRVYVGTKQFDNVDQFGRINRRMDLNESSDSRRMGFANRLDSLGEWRAGLPLSA